MQRPRPPLIRMLAALTVIFSACSDADRPFELLAPPPPKVAPPPLPSDFPAVPAGAAVYYRASPSSLSGTSRYVLHENGVFELQYSKPGQALFQYAGAYTRADTILRFDFGNSAWQATGVVRADSLVVAYNDAMKLVDFEDGRFVRPPVSGAHIHLAASDGSAITRLTAGAWPAWSPDGQTIAFHDQGQIFVINIDGSQRKLLRDGTFPAWSPDGKRIAFASDEGIAVMNADGSAVATLVRHDFRKDTFAPWDMGVAKPAWSPDGSRIAFEHLGDGDIQPAQIFVVNADGSQVRRLTSTSGRQYAESDPAWSPDGTRIALWSFGYGVSAVAADGGVPEVLYFDFPRVAYGARPSWSADGRSLMFGTYRGSSAGPAIWVFTGAPTVVIPGGYDAAWSPVQPRIAFVRDR